jgi:hypothetical protein
MMSGLFLFLPAAFVAALCWPSGYMVSRDIGCGKTDGRAREICQAISESMEWTWLGHAIISPGWRVTWNGVRGVYCREKLTAADLGALETLKRASDWRLQDGAEDLARLIGGANEPANSIFNPKNPAYILKEGCR